MLVRSEAKAQEFQESDEQSDGRDRPQPQGIVPSIQRFLLKPGGWWNEGSMLLRLAPIYHWTLDRVTAKPLLGMALAFILPLLGFIVAPTLEQQFFPLVSRDQVQIEVEFAPQMAIAQQLAAYWEGATGGSILESLDASINQIAIAPFLSRSN